MNTKKYSVFSAGLGKTLLTDYGSSVNEDLVREIIERNQGAEYDVSYKTVMTDSVRGRYAVECSITAKTTPPVCINRLGEVQTGEEDTTPLTEAYEKAFYLAASDLLKLQLMPYAEEDPDMGYDYDAYDFEIPSFDIPEETDDGLADDEIILMGSLKGKKIGEVRNTPQFEHFLEQIQKCDGLFFEDEKRNVQLAKFRRCGKENL